MAMRFMEYKSKILALAVTKGEETCLLGFLKGSGTQVRQALVAGIEIRKAKLNKDILWVTDGAVQARFGKKLLHQSVIRKKTTSKTI